MADIDTPIFKPEQYTDCADRMTAELYKVVLDLRQEVHELRLAVVEMNRRQQIMEGDGERKMKMEELIANVEKWADERGILEKATPLDQFDKTMEEIGELYEHLSMQKVGDKVQEAIKDDIGDIAVTLIIQAKMQGLDFADCLAHAWNEIKDRKGEMVGRQFVKSEG